MKIKLIKTNHLYQRAWERGIHQLEIDKIISKVEAKDIPQKGKSILIVSNDILKKIGFKVNNSTNLVLIAKGRILLTIFYVSDFYNYLKSNSIQNTIII